MASSLSLLTVFVQILIGQGIVGPIDYCFILGLETTQAGLNIYNKYMVDNTYGIVRLVLSSFAALGNMIVGYTACSTGTSDLKNLSSSDKTFLVLSELYTFSFNMYEMIYNFVEQGLDGF